MREGNEAELLDGRSLDGSQLVGETLLGKRDRPQTRSIKLSSCFSTHPRMTWRLYQLPKNHFQEIATMNTRSQNREHSEDAPPKPEEKRGSTQEERHPHRHETKKPRDIVAELAEGILTISFGDPRDATTAKGDKITTRSQLKGQLPAICNEVFSVLGPYNDEGTYQRALARELEDRGVTVLSEVSIPILYKGQRISTRRLDLYLKLDRPVILELKAVNGLTPKNMKQLKFYLQHFKVSDGILINFPRIQEFPAENNAQYVEHVLQPEGGVGLSDRVTRSSTRRKDALPHIIYVKELKTAKKSTKKKHK
jgi:GxxExxY protein